jgi:predicted adenylyl cyclase CyaB
MDRNVEIKAKVADLEAIRERVEAIADRGPIVLEQTDTFFRCAHGRLKLRQCAEAEGELIYYDRADASGPRESRYVVHRTADPVGLRDALSGALGIRGIVRKRRTVYFVGPTRVHLDEVAGLGHFVELEVVLRGEQVVPDGVAVAETLMKKLGIAQSRLVEKAYVDLVR